MSAEEQQPIKPAKAAEAAEATPARAPADENAEFGEQDIVQEDARPFFFRHVTAIVKFCAVFLVAGMWVCTVFLIRDRQDDDYSPWYCLAASTVITLLEIVWFFSKCIFCRDDGGCCCTCWRILMWVDNWKKGFLYIAFAVPAFIKLNILAIVCGVLILILAFLYIVKSCADCRCVGGKKYIRRKKAEEIKKTQPDEEDPPLAPSGAGDAR